VFYSSRFLNSVASAPLLPADSAILLLLHNENNIVAALPVFRQNGIDPLRFLAPLDSEFPDLPAKSGLLGHCWHCYDSQIVAAECETGSLRLLIDSLRAFAGTCHVDYSGLVNVADGRTLEAMVSAGVTPRPMVDRYVMDLTSFASFDDYIGALHPDSRRELRRQFRRYQDSTAELAVEKSPFQDLDEVVRLCRRTAARYDAAFYYPEDETRTLLTNLGDVVRLVSVRIGGERIGVLVCFLDPPRLHVWAAGMRYDKTAFSPYAIGMAEAIRFAITHSIRMLEGGRGNGRIKKKQGFVPLQLYACLQRS